MNQMWKLILLPAVLVACSHNPHKAEKIDTKIEKAQDVSGEKIGIKSGNMVVQRKVEMSEELRRIQNEVYEMEDRVYGNRKYGSAGLYGALKSCKGKLASKEYGGEGKLIWTEPLERITDKEDEWSIGVDEEEKIVAVSEEFLKDRLTRFRGYKKTLMKRQDEYEEKLEICDTDLAARTHDKKKKAAEVKPGGEG